ncbi:hypothetical protein CVO96_07890 [Deinococcus koreensis]|uniref:Uncharacterized protein n=1 Tax=Deinococcus koreensis TaxID=2054903 RepID=A0A2K3UXQ3_9DEIO|nr:hypothetical protein CVO96_07890 [Deinococcus koreensis]
MLVFVTRWSRLSSGEGAWEDASPTGQHGESFGNMEGFCVASILPFNPFREWADSQAGCSPVAQVLLEHRAGDRFDVVSAGLAPGATDSD